MQALFDDFLTDADIAEVFDAPALVDAMLAMEAGLAGAQAELGLIPVGAAETIAQVAGARPVDLDALLRDGRRAGSLAIPLVRMLTAAVAERDVAAARFVHVGSTSQDVLDTAMARQSRIALDRLLAVLDEVVALLTALARRHAGTPMLARTLMQPATVTSFGYKLAGWQAMLRRCAHALRERGGPALAVQLGGAVGTLSAMGPQGGAVRGALARRLGLHDPGASWHTQRDEWMRLASELAILCGALGKIGTDLALLSQGEIGELAEPDSPGRGGSSAMPHKRNPVSAMRMLAAARRAPGALATLVGAMGQAHERGLGDWQAELAQWPQLFLLAHGSATALREALDGVAVYPARMLANIDALRGLVFAEAATVALAPAMGRAAAHHLMEALSRRAAQEGTHLRELCQRHVAADAALAAAVDAQALHDAFDPAVQARPAQALTPALLG